MHNTFKIMIIFFIVFAIIFGLNGCRKRTVYIPETDEDGLKKQGKIIATSILEAINSRDSKTFDSMFAQHVLEHSDYERGREYTFETYNGDIESLTVYVGHTGSQHSSDKNLRYKYASILVDITTTDNKYYCMDLMYYYEHSSEVNKLRKFKLIEGSVDDDTTDFSDMGLRNGVYYPGWVDDILAER